MSEAEDGWHCGDPDWFVRQGKPYPAECDYRDERYILISLWGDTAQFREWLRNHPGPTMSASLELHAGQGEEPEEGAKRQQQPSTEQRATQQRGRPGAGALDAIEPDAQQPGNEEQHR